MYLGRARPGFQRHVPRPDRDDVIGASGTRARYAAYVCDPRPCFLCRRTTRSAMARKKHRQEWPLDKEQISERALWSVIRRQKGDDPRRARPVRLEDPAGRPHHRVAKKGLQFWCRSRQYRSARGILQGNSRAVKYCRSTYGRIVPCSATVSPTEHFEWVKSCHHGGWYNAGLEQLQVINHCSNTFRI